MKVRSHCPINFTLEHFGDKWSLLIIRDIMFGGKRHYNEFLQGGEHISTSVLGDRLKALETADIICKSKDDVKKSRIKYSLTRKGIDLLPIMIELILWGAFYDNETAASKEFVQKATKNKAMLIQQTRDELIKEHL